MHSIAQQQRAITWFLYELLNLEYQKHTQIKKNWLLCELYIYAVYINLIPNHIPVFHIDRQTAPV